MSNKATADLIEAGYRVGQEVLAGRMARSEAQSSLVSRFGLPTRTAEGYWQCPVFVVTGEKLRNTVAAAAWKFNLARIAEVSPEALMVGLNTLMEHIVYQTTRPRSKSNEPGLRNVHAEFAAKLLPFVVFDDDGHSLEARVARSLKGGADARAARLARADAKPAQKLVIQRVFVRNADVIAAVELRADGVCESCERPAPFCRPNGTPYLEVHHRVRLADGGDDTVENAIALCPNCHREHHFGAAFNSAPTPQRTRKAKR